MSRRRSRRRRRRRHVKRALSGLLALLALAVPAGAAIVLVPRASEGDEPVAPAGRGAENEGSEEPEGAGTAGGDDAEGGGDADQDDAGGGFAKTDREGRVTFHVRDQRLGMRILRRAPKETLSIQGRRLRLTCGYTGDRGVTLFQRVIRWPAAERTLEVDIPSDVAAAPQFCALKLGGSDRARAVFTG